jgi:Fur family iron response transcriptional regulator
LHDDDVTFSDRVGALATVYNTLHQFTEAGLLREVVVEPGRSYFDTNTTDHHHFFCDADGRLQDIPGEDVMVSGFPLPPLGTEICRVDVIIRVRPENR